MAHLTSVAMAPRSTLNLHEGHESWAVGLEDLEAEQGHDLAVRLGAVAAALSLAPGGYEAARDTTTFPALVWYLAAVDVVLAYGTELDPVEEGTVEALIERHEEEIAAFLSPGSSTGMPCPTSLPKWKKPSRPFLTWSESSPRPSGTPSPTSRAVQKPSSRKHETPPWWDCSPCVSSQR